jgi:hypothetical protein
VQRTLSIEFFYASLFTFSKRTHAFGVRIDVSLNGITRISSRRIVHNSRRIRFDLSLADPGSGLIGPTRREDWTIGSRRPRGATIVGYQRWRYYVSRAALTGRRQDALSVVRIPALEIENRVEQAHLVGKAGAIDNCHIDDGVLAVSQAIHHEQTRRLRRDPPSANDVRAAIEHVTVSATRIEILLSADQNRGSEPSNRARMARRFALPSEIGVKQSGDRACPKSR